MPLHVGSDGSSQASFCLRRIGKPATCPSIGNVYRLNKGTTVVGRNPAKSDIFLDSAVHKALISRLHARIAIGPDDKVKICDTSLNGTYVNDRKILDTVELNVGDTVTFGHLKGAVLVPGTVAKQAKSEFRFKLEKYMASEDCESSHESVKENTQDYNKPSKPPLESQSAGFIPNISSFMGNVRKDLQDFMEKPKMAIDDTTIGTLDSLASTADSDICDNDEFMAFAFAAGSAMDEESDTELFSVRIPSPTTDNNNKQNLSLSPVYSSQKALNISSQLNTNLLSPREEEDKSEELTNFNEITKQGNTSKRSKRKLLSYCPKKKKYTRQKKCCEEPVQDMCGFGTYCLCPHERQEIVNWVQCDYCQKWYHLECVGLTLNTVTGKSKKFNCGCS